MKKRLHAARIVAIFALALTTAAPGSAQAGFREVQDACTRVLSVGYSKAVELASSIKRSSKKPTLSHQPQTPAAASVKNPKDSQPSIIDFAVKPTFSFPAEIKKTVPPAAIKNAERLPRLLLTTARLHFEHIGKGGFSTVFKISTESAQSLSFPDGTILPLNGLIAKVPHEEKFKALSEEQVSALQERDEKAFNAVSKILKIDRASPTPKYEGVELVSTLFAKDGNNKIAAILQEKSKGLLLDELMEKEFGFYRHLLFDRNGIKFSEEHKKDQNRYLIWALLTVKQSATRDEGFAKVRHRPIPMAYDHLESIYNEGKVKLEEVLEMLLDEPDLDRITDLILRAKDLADESVLIPEALRDSALKDAIVLSVKPWQAPWEHQEPKITIDLGSPNYTFYKDPKTNIITMHIFDL